MLEVFGIVIVGTTSIYKDGMLESHRVSSLMFYVMVVIVRYSRYGYLSCSTDELSVPRHNFVTLA